jgi:hypothetical protein
MPHITLVSPEAFPAMMILGEENYVLIMQPATPEQPSLRAVSNQPAPTTLLHQEPLPEDEMEMFKKVVPEVYHDFFNIFSHAKAKTFPPHRSYDHTINIEDDGVPPHGPIYPLSNTELEALQEYLNDMLSKGFIQSSQSPGGAPVVFAKKKDCSLRMCIDYRGLNRLT